MAKIEAPIKIDGFKCVEDMAQAVLNYTYKGKTLKEWADSISEPKNNADRIRAMSDEELAELLTVAGQKSYDSPSRIGILYKMNLDWLKEEAKND